MKAVTTSPRTKTIKFKRSVSAEQRGSREEGGFAQGWVRRYISRQGSPLVRERRKSQPISQRDKQEEQSLQDPSYAELERTKHSRESPLRAYKPGLWRMAAVRGLRKRRWSDTEARWKLNTDTFYFYALTLVNKIYLLQWSQYFEIILPYNKIYFSMNVNINQTCDYLSHTNPYYCRVAFFKAVSIPNNESNHFVLDLVVLVLAPMNNESYHQQRTFICRVWCLRLSVYIHTHSPYVSILWRRTNAVGSSLRSWPIERMFEFAKLFLSNL